jgi:glyoxylase-like metal-dependent hydrolase (beta-lactamase superfamily II)
LAGAAPGVQAHPGREHNDLVLWVAGARAIVAGDSLGDFGAGLAVNERPRGGLTHVQLQERLRPLLELPVELVLPAHGLAADRAGLEDALI